jgi:DNA-binding NarL/FixJ family response regulator
MPERASEAALSNRQTADHLVLSEQTVETHVRSILAKLDFSTEIATWVLRISSPSPASGT